MLIIAGIIRFVVYFNFAPASAFRERLIQISAHFFYFGMDELAKIAGLF
jgi:hypothetical protein